MDPGSSSSASQAESDDDGSKHRTDTPSEPYPAQPDTAADSDESECVSPEPFFYQEDEGEEGQADYEELEGGDIFGIMKIDQQIGDIPVNYEFTQQGSNSFECGATASSAEIEQHEIDDNVSSQDLPIKQSNNKRKRRSKNKGKSTPSDKRLKASSVSSDVQGSPSSTLTKADVENPTESKGAATVEKPGDELPSTFYSKKHWLLKNPKNTEKIPKQTKEIALMKIKGVEIPDMTKMKHIIFLDIENFPKFFSALPSNLPEDTFVWVFKGANSTWKPPMTNEIYSDAVSRGLVYHQSDSGPTKNAADFSISVMVGIAHLVLSDSIPFTIVSNDKSFYEVERIFKITPRKILVFEPLGREKDELYALLKTSSGSK